MSGPITPTPPSGAQTSAPKGQVVQIVSLPDGLRDVGRAMRIEGEVIAQNKDGSVRIRTEQGDIDIQVRGRQPQVGAQVEIDIPAGHPPRQATIRNAPVPVPVTPQPAPTIPLPQTPVASPPPQTTQPVQTNPDDAVRPPIPVGTNQPPAPDVHTLPVVQTKPALPPLSAGQTVQLVLLPEDTALPLASTDVPPEENLVKNAALKTETQAAIIAQKAQGNIITSLLQAVKSVLPQTAQPAQAQPTGVTPQPIITILPQTQAVQNPLALLQQPLVLSAKIIAITSPTGQTMFAPQVQVQMPPTALSPMQPAPTATTIPQPATPTAQPIMAIVSALTEQNKAVIPIPVSNTGKTQNFVIQTPPGTLPVGTQITLLPQVSSPTIIPTSFQPQAGTMSAPSNIAAPPASLLPPAWRALLPLMQPASLWPAMDDVFQSFYQATPQAAQILGRVIPNPANGASFGPAVLLFAAALKAGDLQAWIGDKKLDMINKLGKDGLLSRLSGETSSLAQSADATPTEWKSFPVPMLWQNEISKVLFHVRREPDEQEKDQNNDGTHFVMDVSLTRMGEVQLDGLVRGKRLDLIVRTQLPISLPMQDAMRTAYATALDGTNIYGDMGFQSDIKNFVKVIGTENIVHASA